MKLEITFAQDWQEPGEYNEAQARELLAHILTRRAGAAVAVVEGNLYTGNPPVDTWEADCDLLARLTRDDIDEILYDLDWSELDWVDAASEAE